MVKGIIKGMAMHGNKIKGISLRSIKEGTFLGLYAKLPRNSMEFEELLSYAADLRSLFGCDLP
jgi:hypothetical protein